MWFHKRMFCRNSAEIQNSFKISNWNSQVKKGTQKPPGLKWMFYILPSLPSRQWHLLMQTGSDLWFKVTINWYQNKHQSINQKTPQTVCGKMVFAAMETGINSDKVGPTTASVVVLTWTNFWKKFKIDFWVTFRDVLRLVYTYRLRLRARLRARQVFTLCQWKRAVWRAEWVLYPFCKMTARFHWHNVKTWRARRRARRRRRYV